MKAIKVETMVEKKGELHLSNLPVQTDQRIEVIVRIPEENRSVSSSSSSPVDDKEWQNLVDTIRHTDPVFPTLDEAMGFSRGRP